MHVQTNPLVPLALLQCGQTGTVGQIVGSPEPKSIGSKNLACGQVADVSKCCKPAALASYGSTATKLCFRDAGCFSVLIDLGEPTA